MIGRKVQDCKDCGEKKGEEYAAALRVGAHI